MRKPTTKKQFEYFRSCCEKAAKRYGLSNWVINYRHSNLKEEGYIADTEWNSTSMEAYIRLNKGVDEEELVDNELLKEAAIHEVRHILLGQINDLLENYYADEFIDPIIHDLIQRLENANRYIK